MSDIEFSKRGRVSVAHLTEGQVTEPLWIGPQLTVSVHPDEGGGSGYIEYSTSPNEDVKAGSAKWITWGFGEVSAACSTTTEGRLTAIRAQCTSGGMTVETL